MSMARGNWEWVGAQQYAVIFRARRSIFKPIGGFVSPNNHLERRACKRLAARGLLTPATGYPDCWYLTDRGRQCWLKVIEMGDKG